MPHEEVEEKITDLNAYTPIFHFRINIKSEQLTKIIEELIESNKIMYFSTLKINLN